MSQQKKFREKKKKKNVDLLTSLHVSICSTAHRHALRFQWQR